MAGYTWLDDLIRHMLPSGQAFQAAPLWSIADQALVARWKCLLECGEGHHTRLEAFLMDESTYARDAKQHTLAPNIYSDLV